MEKTKIHKFKSRIVLGWYTLIALILLLALITLIYFEKDMMPEVFTLSALGDIFSSIINKITANIASFIKILVSLAAILAIVGVIIFLITIISASASEKKSKFEYNHARSEITKVRTVISEGKAKLNNALGYGRLFLTRDGLRHCSPRVHESYTVTSIPKSAITKVKRRTKRLVVKTVASKYVFTLPLGTSKAWCKDVKAAMSKRATLLERD